MSIVPDRVYKLVKIAFDKKFRKREKEYKRLSKFPRFKHAETDLYGKQIRIADGRSFLFMQHEIFDLEIYKFESGKNDPFIIDCGSNIGLSIIYFKKLYPDATIVGFEPDDTIFQILQHNIKLFNLSKVELIRKACWNANTRIEFFSEGADGGRKLTSNDKLNKTISVEAIQLKNFIEREVDFLKIDIEGAEFIVLNDIQDRLHLVKNIFVEFHSFTNEEQMLPELLGLLKKAGFRLYISPVSNTAKRPFLYRPDYLGIDNNINIYGFRY
jgi:FkbM family methyltransferase